MGGCVLLFLRQAYTGKYVQQSLRALRSTYNELFTVHTELVAAHAQLGASVIDIEELACTNERQRLARELHDTLTQGLVSLILQLEAIDASLADEQLQRARNVVQLTRQNARTTLVEARRAIHDLRSETPAQSNLGEAIRAEIQHFSQTTDIACRCDPGPFETIPAVPGEQIFQAIKEGLANVARHACAQMVWIRIRSSGAMYDLEICDDGQGFDPEHVAAGHYGLLGLRERARQHGGELHIRSIPGKGTCLRMCLPCSRKGQGICAV